MKLSISLFLILLIASSYVINIVDCYYELENEKEEEDEYEKEEDDTAYLDNVYVNSVKTKRKKESADYDSTIDVDSSTYFDMVDDTYDEDDKKSKKKNKKIDEDAAFSVTSLSSMTIFVAAALVIANHIFT